MKRQLLALGFAFSVGLASAGMVQPAAGAEALKIVYGSPWVGYGPLYIAAEKGFFKDEGLEIEISFIESDTPQDGLDLLTTKQIDGRFATLDEAALYWQSETPYAAILAADISSGGDGVLVRNDRNIASIKDLRGKTVALWLSTPSHFLLSYLLQQSGLSEEDVTVVDMSAENAAAAVVAGDVDAAVTWNPYLAKAAENPTVKTLVTSKDTPGLIADVLVMRKDTLASDVETCQALVRAWNKAVEYQRANPDEGAAIVAKGLNYGTAEDVKSDLAGVTLQGREENAEFFSGTGPGTAHATTSFAIELWSERGRLATPVEAEDLVNDSCLEG
jgi:NitT/TauT family transport system substrate-binding protein